MPKFFCEYCGIYLTHCGPWGRKQHKSGKKHIRNKIEYYNQILHELRSQDIKKRMAMMQKMQISNPFAMFPPGFIPPNGMNPMNQINPPSQINPNNFGNQQNSIPQINNQIFQTTQMIQPLGNITTNIQINKS